MIRNIPLGLLINFAPLFSDLGDELPCDGRTFYFFCFSIAINDDAYKDRNNKSIEGEVERNKEQSCGPGFATPILPIHLKIRIGGNLKANEVGLGCLNCVSDLLNGRFENGELEEGEESGNEVLVTLIEPIDFCVVPEEAEELDSGDGVDEEKDADEEQDEASAGQDDGECLDDLLREGDLVEH